jgi:hypothetical protein
MLKSLLERDVSKSLQKTMDKCYEMLQDEIVGAGIPIDPGGIYYAWKHEIESKLVGLIEWDEGQAGLYQYDWPAGQHGSTLNSRMGAGDAPSDVRSGFPKIIFDGLAPLCPALGQSGGTFPARDAWTPFLAQVSNKAGKILATYLAQQGWKVVGIGKLSMASL